MKELLKFGLNYVFAMLRIGIIIVAIAILINTLIQ